MNSKNVTFFRCFFRYLMVVHVLIQALIATICICAIGISVVEGRTLGESFYFTFVTALSIGYGDIVPVTIIGRVISVFIGLVGMVFVGLTVAVATRALADTVKHTHPHNHAKN